MNRSSSIATRSGALPLTILLGVASGLSSGCGGSWGSITCTSDPPPQISFSGAVRTAATVGMPYGQGLQASSSELLGASHGIEGISLPPGASVDAYGVSWVPGPDFAGTTQAFRVRTDRDFCGRTAELAWSVQVYPEILITRFEVAPAVVSTRGTRVAVVAEFTGGDGQLESPFAAALASGVPLDAGTLSAQTTFTLLVTNGAGDSQERSVVVSAQAPPVIQDTAIYPAVVTVGDTVTLSWSLGGTVTSLTLDPGAWSLDPYRTWEDVAPLPGTTYTLTARNDVGDVATATFTPTVLPRPAISSLTATPPAPPYLGSTEVVALFEGGTGQLGTPAAPGGQAVESGVPVTVGPLSANADLWLRVTNAGGAAAFQSLRIGLSGPGTWEILAGGPGDGRSRHTATSLADGRVLMTGGSTGSGAFPAATQIYEPADGSIAPGPALLHPRRDHAAALLADGRVLVAGGTDFTGAPVDEAEVLDPIAGTSIAVGSAGAAWWFPSLIALPDGAALLHSASMFSTGGGAVLRYDPAAGSLAPLTVVYGLGWVRSFALADGRVLMLSGGRYDLTPSVFLDPANGATTVTGSTLREMAPFEAILLADGRVLATDGSPSAEVFDPATGLFSPTGDPLVPGPSGKLALLPDGRVLVAGGRSSLYAPADGAFRETGGMLGSGDRPLLLLPDGTVLASGDVPERYRP